MTTHAEKTPKSRSQSVSNGQPQMQSNGESTFQFIDKRPEAVAQRKLQEMADSSPQVSQMRAFQDLINSRSRAKQLAQLQAMADNYSAQQQQPIQKKIEAATPAAEVPTTETVGKNNTASPDNLKTGIENLSEISLDDVKVRRRSYKPAQRQSHAYAQGRNIPLGPGQEKYLPHEAWHVVQQKQGRVKSIKEMKGKVNVNDDVGVEKEADVMGNRALQLMEGQGMSKSTFIDSNDQNPNDSPFGSVQGIPVQRTSTKYTQSAQTPDVSSTNEQAVQRVAYRRESSEGGGELIVTENADGITIKGWIRRKTKNTGLTSLFSATSIKTTDVEGSLNYHRDRSDATRLVIGTIKCKPKRTGAGTILVYHMAKYALANNYTTIGTDLSALEEGTPEFYQSIGLAPSQQRRDDVAQTGVEANSTVEKAMLWSGDLHGSAADVLIRASHKLAESNWVT